jgi:hypothetical protein
MPNSLDVLVLNNLTRALSQCVSLHEEQPVIHAFDLQSVALQLRPFLPQTTDKELQRRVVHFCRKYSIAGPALPLDVVRACLVWLDLELSDESWTMCQNSVALAHVPQQQDSMDSQAVVIDICSDDEAGDSISTDCGSYQLCAFWPAASPVSSASALVTISSYIGKTCSELMLVLKQRDKSLDEALSKIKLIQQTVRRQSEQLVILTANDNSKDDEAPVLVISDHVGDGRHVSIRDALAIAIRRNFSHVSTDTMGSVLNLPLSHQSVARCEFKCGTSLRAFANRWHLECEHNASAAAAAASFQRAVSETFHETVQLFYFRVRCDATNSGVWQKLKLFNLELLSAYLVDLDALQQGRFVDAFATCEQYADLQVVDDCTAAGTLGTRDKQIEGLGAPLPQDRVGAPLGRALKCRTWHFGNDQGPDQEAAVRCTYYDTDDDPYTIVWAWFCSRHQGHLIVEDGIKLTDRFVKDEVNKDWKYMGLTSKILHVWRDYHRQFLSKWTLKYGAASAKAHARKAAPRLVKTRWGCKKAVEIRLDDCTQERFVPTCLDVIAKRVAQDADEAIRVAAAPIPVNAQEVIDEIGAEAATHNKLAMGRWRKDVYTHIGDKLYWILVRINRYASQPITHFENFMMQKVEPGEFGKLFHLATGKASSLAAEFDVVLNDNGCWQAVFDSCPSELVASVNKYLVLYILQQGEGFDRRIVHPILKLRP